MSRATSVRRAAVSLLVSFILCFGLGVLLCAPLLAAGGYIALSLTFALNTLVCFGLPGYMCRRKATGRGLRFKDGAVSPRAVIMAALMAVACQPFIEWAAYIDHLASQAAGVPADFADAANDMLLDICDFGSAWHWPVAVIVVALLPAVCEELFFRGALMPLLRRSSGSWKVAVVVTAVIFSAVHMDPSGFLTRTVMGVILGVLLVVSRSLWVPIAFHFANNALVVVTLSMVDDPAAALAATPEMPDAVSIFFSLAATVCGLYFVDLIVNGPREVHGFTRVG